MAALPQMETPMTEASPPNITSFDPTRVNPRAIAEEAFPEIAKMSAANFDVGALFLMPDYSYKLDYEESDDFAFRDVLPFTDDCAKSPELLAAAIEKRFILEHDISRAYAPQIEREL